MNRPSFFLGILICCSNFLFAQTSVLSTGNWYKIGVSEDGVYRLSYSDLQSLGINPANIDPRNIRIYGNGGGMLPELNSEPRAVDLVENAINVLGEGDGVFNTGDHILFYGQGPHRWKYNSSTQRFEHAYNIYSETTYYFITADLGLGKRIALQLSSVLPSTDTVATFDDFAFHEMDSTNFIHSGREWYGEQFDLATASRIFSFSFPNLVTSDSVYLKAKFAARSTAGLSTFNIAVNSQQILSSSLQSVCPDYTCPFANTSPNSGGFTSSQSQINVDVHFSSIGTSAIGWLDFIELNARRNLVFAGTTLQFRDVKTVGAGRIAEFFIINTSGNLSTWDITDPQNVKLQETFSTGLLIRTRVATDVLKEFIVFDGLSYLSPQLLGTVPNQNLRSLASANLLIVTHPSFLSAANTLANHHRSFDGLSVAVATTEQIFKEFSSGAQDISAIRDFARMMYLNPSPDSLKYLLLFGDASYDYKDRISGNTNFVPGYQSVNSVSTTNTFFTDDYFGLMDSSEGILTLGSTIDIGIGRLPVKSLAEANVVVNKILHYNSNQTLGKWRKETVFIGDDEDGNIHMSQADQLSTYIDDTYCDYNINKIYLDTYPETMDSLIGSRYPVVKQAINEKIQEGKLIFNFTGHGGPNGWAHERILEPTDVNAWSNKDRLPLIMCASSETSLIDDPSVTSIGELWILKQDAGGIATFGSSRLSYSGANFSINVAFIQRIFEPINGDMPRLGDITKLAKTAISQDVNNRKHLLLGDPAIRLAYPKHKIVLTDINGNSISMFPDSFFASSIVTINGRIEDNGGNLLSGFNGQIFFDLFDKLKIDTTLGNSGGTKFIFKQWRIPVIIDSANVVNGVFSFSIIVPAGVDSILGFGKLSLYASNGITDASGCHTNFLIGGGNQTFTAIPSFDAGAEFLIYPSPAIGKATIEVRGFVPEKAVFTIYDDTGREVSRMNISENKFTFSTESLAKGIYVFTFQDKTNEFQKSGKLMVH